MGKDVLKFSEVTMNRLVKKFSGNVLDKYRRGMKSEDLLLILEEESYRFFIQMDEALNASVEING